MNYYSLRLYPLRSVWGGARQLSCCGVTEAHIEGISAQYSPEKRVEHILSLARRGNRSLLIWNVVPDIHSNAECEEIIVDLPNTTFIAQFRNRNGGNTIRTYVTNLVKEW